MLKQKIKKVRSLSSSTRALAVAAVVLAATITGGLVHADQYDSQIQALQKENAQKQIKADAFESQAKDYQDAVNRLSQEVESLQKTIDDAQHQSDILQGQINKAKAELEHFKVVLGESIVAMYQEGQISTLEILASSNDLSDFVDKQQYRTAVQDKVKETLDQINELKTKLETKQRQLEALISQQKDHQAQLAATQHRQNVLLHYSNDQKAKLNAQISDNLSAISSLRAKQAAANQAQFGSGVSAGDPGHGGYPGYLDNPGQDTVIDPWGMFNRECVSYTAWKVQQTFGYMPYWGGRGNAIQWPSDAQADGIPTGSTPRVHSVAIWPVGYYGHAMWVEAVYGNGMIRVSQYNYDYQGHYSEMTISSAGLTFIYFH